MLQERVGLETLAGMVVILSGVVLATGTRLSLLRRADVPRGWRLDRAAGSRSDELG